MLAQHLLERAAHNTHVKTIDQPVLDVFADYHWPGNVRELSNVIERALPFSDGATIRLSALPDALRPAGTPPPSGPGAAMSESANSADTTLPFKDAKDQLINAFERQYLVDLLDKFEGNVSKAARAADMDRKSITRLMKKHKITRDN